MSKWSARRTCQSKSSYCTFWRPKYCASAGVVASMITITARSARSAPPADGRDIPTPKPDMFRRWPFPARRGLQGLYRPSYAAVPVILGLQAGRLYSAMPASSLKRSAAALPSVRTAFSDNRKAMAPTRLLRWLYLGRLTLAAGIFGGALFMWQRTTPAITLLATLTLLLSLGSVLAGLWWTQRRVPGKPFLYLQVIFDTLLITAIVHMTAQAGTSPFAPLYILNIAA